MNCSLFLFGFFICLVSCDCTDTGCGCDWANQETCATNDGSSCYIECCCKGGFIDPNDIGNIDGNRDWATGFYFFDHFLNF